MSENTAIKRGSSVQANGPTAEGLRLAQLNGSQHVTADSMLPPNLVLTERAAVDFRQWLIDNGCGDWTIFHTGDDELYDVCHPHR